MTKLIPIVLNGRKWIQLSQLSVENSQNLKNWLPSTSLNLLDFQGMILQDCVDFNDYECWFRSMIGSNLNKQILEF